MTLFKSEKILPLSGHSPTAGKAWQGEHELNCCSDPCLQATCTAVLGDPRRVHHSTLSMMTASPWPLTQTLRHQAAFLLCFLPLPTLSNHSTHEVNSDVSKVPTLHENPNTEPRRTAEDSGSITGLCLGLATWAGLLTGLQPLADESARRVYVSRFYH